jgi:uncharacterized membrane protein YeaQ/YmgE (transglycosylase-associated protein family)
VIATNKEQGIMVSWLLWIVGGVTAGWLVGLVMRGRGYGLVGDLLLGLLGGVAGGWLLGFVGPTQVSHQSWLTHIIVSIVGGTILVGVSRLIRRST